jgi:uncharacterized protein Usg
MEFDIDGFRVPNNQPLSPDAKKKLDEHDQILQDQSFIEYDIDTNLKNIEHIQSELDEILDSLEQTDDRKIDVTQLNEEFIKNVIDEMYHDSNFLLLMKHNGEIISINEWISNIFEKHELTFLFNHMKNFFDITDDELDHKLHQKRFGLEVGRTALRIELHKMEQKLELSQKELLRIHKDYEDITITRQELEIVSPEELDSDKIKEEPNLLYSRATVPKSGIPTQSEKPILIQFDMVRELELKLRELLKSVFSHQENWWYEYIPIEIRDKCQYRNRNNPDFQNLLNQQSTDLIDKLMFSEIQMTIASKQNANFNKLFKNIFDGFHYVNGRLIEANILRNKICHQDTLNPKQQMQLEHIKSELIYDINEYLGRF